MSIIQGIDDIKSISRFHFENGCSRKECLQSLLDRFYSLIDARQFLDSVNGGSTEFIFKVSGIENKTYLTKGLKGNYTCKTKLSYLQLYNLLVRYAKTGTILKRPYNITNKEKLSLI